MVDVVSIFKSATVAYGLAKYIGLVEDELMGSLKKVMREKFESGSRSLLRAKTSESERQRESLLIEARGCFNSAISLEEGITKAYAWLDLAVCDHFLGDKTNARTALREILNIEVKEKNALDFSAEAAKNDGPSIAVSLLLGTIVAIAFTTVSTASESYKRAELAYENEKKSLSQLKSSIETYLEG